MMGWAILLILIALIVVGLIILGRMPRTLWELVGATLLLGGAGYAWQGHPSFRGDQRDPQQNAPRFEEEEARLRRSFGEYGETAHWLTISDGLARQGNSKAAANVLLSGIKANPDDPALWVGLGNAMVAHGGGILSPAADYSYRQAMKVAPQSAAAPYFYGLALAKSGRYEAAREVWNALAGQLDERTPLFDMLKADLAQLNRILAGQQGATAP